MLAGVPVQLPVEVRGVGRGEAGVGQGVQAGRHRGGAGGGRHWARNSRRHHRSLFLKLQTSLSAAFKLIKS